MSVVILSSSFKDLLLFDLKVFDFSFFVEARCSTKEEKKNSFR